MKKLMLCFPGIGYTIVRLLLKYTSEKYKEMGYEIFNINYNSVEFNKTEGLEKAAKPVNATILKQIENINFEEYDNIVFISKSLGTMAAVWLEEYLHINIKHILLTPLPEVISYIIGNPSKVLGTAIGTKDQFIDYKTLVNACKENNVQCLVYEGLGHSLESKEDAELNKKVIEEVCMLCK